MATLVPSNFAYDLWKQRVHRGPRIPLRNIGRKDVGHLGPNVGRELFIHDDKPKDCHILRTHGRYLAEGCGRHCGCRKSSFDKGPPAAVVAQR